MTALVNAEMLVYTKKKRPMLSFFWPSILCLAQVIHHRDHQNAQKQMINKEQRIKKQAALSATTLPQSALHVKLPKWRLSGRYCREKWKMIIER